MKYRLQPYTFEFAVSMTGLKSEHLLAYRNWADTKNRLYVFREFFDGQRLDQIINKGKVFAEEQATDYARQILMGYHELLSHGLKCG